MFRFVKSDFVAVGTFNIYVLQPNWFAAVGLFTEGQKIAVQTDFARPGYHFAPSESDVEWHISPDRVVASSRDSNADCGSQVARVINKLEWTPLHAVGGNFVFEADRTDYEQLRVKPAIPGRDDWNWRQSASAISVESAGRQFNLTLLVLPDKLQLVANIHTDLSKMTDRKGRLAEAEAASVSFKGDRDKAIDFASRFFGTKFE